MPKLFLLFLTTLLLAQNSTTFSKTELLHVKNKYGQIALNRISDYHKQMLKFEALTQEKKLLHVNNYLNRLLSEYDAVMNKQEEYWATPKEFLTLGRGDCEDYVSIKYHSLIDLGFDEERLFFAIVKDTYTGTYHMVLLYEQELKKPPLVLDNLSFKILALSVRTDLKLIDLFNRTGRYHYTKNYEKIPQKGNFIEFKELQERIQSGG